MADLLAWNSQYTGVVLIPTFGAKVSTVLLPLDIATPHIVPTDEVAVSSHRIGSQKQTSPLPPIRGACLSKEKKRIKVNRKKS